MSAFFWFIPSICVFLGILLLSTAFSVPIQVEGISSLDKLQHAFAYLVLVLSLLFGFWKSGLLSVKVWVWIFFATSIYGVSLELVQYTLFPNRYFEWLDALANVCGVILGSLVFRVFMK